MVKYNNCKIVNNTCSSTLKYLCAMMACILLSACGAMIKPTQQKMALIIGNDNYINGNFPKLSNAIRDAKNMASTLESLGFEVTFIKDATESQTKREIDNFGARLDPGVVGLFYYAGHGKQEGFNNYIIPIDAEVSETGKLFKSFSLNQILYVMQRADEPHIAILDSCRDESAKNAANKDRGTDRIKSVNDPKSIDTPIGGTIIGYATSSDKSVSDDGFYTQAVIDALQVENKDIEEVLKGAGNQAMLENKQTTWFYSSYYGKFIINPKRPSLPPANG